MNAMEQFLSDTMKAKDLSVDSSRNLIESLTRILSIKSQVNDQTTNQSSGLDDFDVFEFWSSGTGSSSTRTTIGCDDIDMFLTQEDIEYQGDTDSGFHDLDDDKSEPLPHSQQSSLTDIHICRRDTDKEEKKKG